jgi:hypothetical protein
MSPRPATATGPATGAAAPPLTAMAAAPPTAMAPPTTMAGWASLSPVRPTFCQVVVVCAGPEIN